MWVTGPVSLGLVFVLLLVSVSFALRLPGLGLLSPVREETLGYGSVRGERFPPLRDAFVTRVLGASVEPGPDDALGSRPCGRARREERS